MAKKLTAAEIVSQIRHELEAPVEEEKNEGFCAGARETVVESLVVCFDPSVEVLKRCMVEKKGMIICREHPFYMTNTYWSRSLPEAQKDDPATKAKADLIKESDVVIYRLSSAWDKAHPGAQARALAQAMDLTPELPRDKTPADVVYCNVPKVKLSELASDISTRLKSSAVRVTGDPNLSISRLVIMPGLVNVFPLAKALEDQEVNAVVVGETCEWRATPYFQDLITSGRAIGMLLVGYFCSGDPGGTEVAQWLRNKIPEIPVEYWPGSKYLWIPLPRTEQRKGETQ